MAAGCSGLLHATTGSGKTYAVALGALQRGLALPQPARGAPPLQVLWITPMRALAADTTRALALPLADLAPALDAGPAQRRHAGRRARAAGPTFPHGAGHHARVAEPDAHARERGAGAGRGAHRRRRRMARADGQQARCAGAAGAGPAGALEPGVSPCGACRPRWAIWTRRCGCWWVRARPPLVQGRIDKTLVIDTLMPAEPGPLLLGRPPGRADAVAGGGGDRAQQHHAGLHQHPFAGRDLVPAADPASGPNGRASSRCTTARSTRRCASGSSWA